MFPESFGRYQVESQIGDGAMGRVYRAFDPLARRVVAIKTIKSELLSDTDSEEYLKRFRREAQAAGALLHPNIVTIFDIGEDYFVMEHLEGVTLHALLRDRGRLDLDHALRILGPVAEALDFAHRRGVVHRDIKPANIMVLPDGRPKLMDFGVAHIESTVMTKRGQFLGSPSYMAPEQIAGGDITPRADLFSLAAVAYELLVGKKAFDGPNITGIIYQIVHEQPRPPRTVNVDLPPHHDAVFARALAKDPAQRFELVADFVTALDRRAGEARTQGVPQQAGQDGVGSPTLDLRPGTIQDPAEVLAGGESPLATAEHAASRPAWRRSSVPALAAAALLLGGVAALFLLRPHGGVRESATPATAPADEPAAPPTAVTQMQGPVAAPPTESPRPEASEDSPSPMSGSAPRPEKPASSPTGRRPSAVREGDLVRLGPGVSPPRRISGPPAEYPRAAQRKRLQGTVVVEMIVTETGEPIDLRIVESAGEVLDQAVLSALGRWRFEPASKDGVKVRVRWQARHSFVFE